MKTVRRVVAVFLLIMTVRCMVGCDALAHTKNPNVDDELVAHANENGYAAFIDYMENEMDEKDYEVVMNLLEENYIDQGLQTLRYSSVSGKNDYCYIDGTYTIPYNVRLTVAWAVNIDIDMYNENFYCNRHYAVIDSTKDAYLLIKDSGTGYKLICIVPDRNEAIVSEVDYTIEGFNHLCDVIENEKQSWLTNISEYPVITTELLDNLYANEYKYDCVYEYAKHLADSEQETIKKKIDEGQITDGIVTIQLISATSDYYYTYENGVYTIDPSYYSFVKWTQNMEQITDEEATEIKYKVTDMAKDAYMLLGNKNGFVLIRFAVN